MPLCRCCKTLVTYNGRCRRCGSGPDECVVRPHCTSTLDRGTDIDYTCSGDYPTSDA